MEDFELTRKQFDILTVLEKNNAFMTQRDLEKATGFSLGTINSSCKALESEGLIEGGTITAKGIMALEPYRVKRAVFIAAGFGSRLVPITLNTPKPLVRVNGERIIDTLLDAVTAVGIKDIVIIIH